jgi:hypothetical protein
MRDKTHLEQIKRWAEYVKDNSDWKKKHTEFINAQFEISSRFYKKLAETPEGREKVKELKKTQDEELASIILSCYL